MDIIFYKLQDEANDVKKTRTLTATASYSPKTISGYLRGSTSKITPSIEFACDITQFNDWNYCYIADFKRYYFVMDVISVRAGVTAVDLKVDVLTSFFTPANQTKIVGFIGRCSNPTIYDSFIPDRKVQFKSNKNITVVEPTRTPVAGNIENLTLSWSASNNILISLTNTADIPPVVDVSIPTPLIPLSGTSTIPKYFFRPVGNSYLYCTQIGETQTDTSVSPTITLDKITWFLNHCANEDNMQSFVNAIIVYPFSIPNDSTQKEVKIQDKNVTLAGLTSKLTMKSVTMFNSGYLILKDFTLDESTIGHYNNDFTKYEPYTICDIYIPFSGWQNIDIKHNLGCRLFVIYNIDYTTGNAITILYNKTKEEIIFQTTVQMGVQVPVNTTNQKENELKDQNYTRNFFTGLLTSAGMGIAGAVTHNPYLAVAGVTGVVSSIMQFTNNENLLLDRASAQTTPPTSSSAMLSGLKVLIRWTKLETVNFDTSTQISSFTKQIGIPTNKIANLDTIPVTGDYHTYAEIVDLHTTSEDGLYSLDDITSPEIDELKRLCAEGIYL